MPLPKPRKDEDKQPFISRCHAALADEFPDSAQRHAVCERQWKKKPKKSEDTTMTQSTRNRRQPNSRVRAKYDPKSGLVRLNVPLSVKAETIDTTARTFEGLAATWDEDLGQDIIHKGAFKESIANWKSGEDAMPLLNSHDHFDIFAALGQAVAMKETDAGLWTKWEVLEGDDGDKVLARLRPSATTGRAIIGKMSIGFMPLKFEFEQPEGTDSFFDRIRHINKADLKEVSLVLFPMNPGATIDASTVKMWLKMASDTDPKKIDSITRLELRRLNSKIGLLLSKQRDEDDEDEDQDDTPSRKSSVRPAKKPTQRKAEDDTDDVDEDSEDDTDEEESLDDDSDDTDESDDTDDTDDEESDDEVEDEEEEPDESADEPKKSGKKKVEKKDKLKKGQYAFSEALQHRLKQVTLKSKTEEAKTRIPQ